jgi:transcriptional regulator with GAF, ATPase, and Fis domain
MLGAGIQDVTNTLVDKYELNDVLQMVLETMHRSLGFQHTLIFIRDNRLGMMVARFGFGAATDEIIFGLRFPLSLAQDVFYLAIDKGVDIIIEDVNAGNIADKIPSWFRNVLDVQCFLLLPIMVNKVAIGLIYADMQEANSLQMTQRQLALLRTLRNQVIIAIKQRF